MFFTPEIEAIEGSGNLSASHLLARTGGGPAVDPADEGGVVIIPTPATKGPSTAPAHQSEPGRGFTPRVTTEAEWLDGLAVRTKLSERCRAISDRKALAFRKLTAEACWSELGRETRRLFKAGEYGGRGPLGRSLARPDLQPVRPGPLALLLALHRDRDRGRDELLEMLRVRLPHRLSSGRCSDNRYTCPKVPDEDISFEYGGGPYFQIRLAAVFERS